MLEERPTTVEDRLKTGSFIYQSIVEIHLLESTHFYGIMMLRREFGKESPEGDGERPDRLALGQKRTTGIRSFVCLT